MAANPYEPPKEGGPSRAKAGPLNVVFAFLARILYVLGGLVLSLLGIVFVAVFIMVIIALIVWLISLGV